MTAEDAEVIAEAIVETIHTETSKGLAALEALSHRIAELESRPVISYRGVFEAGTQYGPGDMVTCAGSMWHCQAITRARPGDPGADSRAWTLAVKRGRDGNVGGASR